MEATVQLFVLDRFASLNNGGKQKIFADKPCHPGDERKREAKSLFVNTAVDSRLPDAAVSV